MNRLHPQLSYRKNELFFESVSLQKLMKEVGSPAYIYSKACLLDNFKRFDEAFKSVDHLVLFAMKSNSNGALLSVLGKAGAGVDIVSAGELYRARRAGIPPHKIVFAGVGKTPEEIRIALEADILMFNVESEEELAMIHQVATELHKPAPVAIRVNPDVDALTHGHITTGKKENKFGISLDKALPVFRAAAKMPRINLLGIHAHIGSQITSVKPYQETLKRLQQFLDQLEKEGISLRYIDLGGGLGVRYENENPPVPKALAKAITQVLKKKSMKLLFEPGRFISAEAGLLLTKVLYRKHTGSKQFVIVDAAMNDLARPALYDAYHEVYTLTQKKGKTVTADLVGPVCESGDYLAKGRKIRLPEAGEGFAIATAGAYGFVMGSQYNSRPRPVEVLVDGAKWQIVRERETLEDLVRGERLLA